MQELKCSLTVDFVDSVEELNFGSIAMPQFVVQAADFGELVGDPLVDSDTVPMPPFHHERAGKNQIGHLRVIKRHSQVELVHLILVGEHVAVLPVIGHVFPDPLVEIA